MTLKLEVGKSYLTVARSIVSIIGVTPKGLFVGVAHEDDRLLQHKEGVYYHYLINGSAKRIPESNTFSSDIEKEYHETVVHKRILMWIKDNNGVHPVIFMTSEYTDHYAKLPGVQELKREEISYTED